MDLCVDARLSCIDYVRAVSKNHAGVRREASCRPKYALTVRPCLGPPQVYRHLGCPNASLSRLVSQHHENCVIYVFVFSIQAFPSAVRRTIAYVGPVRAPLFPPLKSASTTRTVLNWVHVDTRGKSIVFVERWTRLGLGCCISGSTLSCKYSPVRTV